MSGISIQIQRSSIMFIIVISFNILTNFEMLSISNLHYNSCTTTSLLCLNLIVLFLKIAACPSFEPSYLRTNHHVDQEFC
ncbi:hypothetical protein BRADI_4g05973v3 [Brachypodium distachyon]|uniref:Uncharacterized protein n=1 Tax=Brachypodium distachyon TaxID=15368 RepID=A0A0Q3GZU7_BRADI|nr:hypothetical protein BRADI_4g05973v3 [Brachypodium distachyon]